MGDEGSRTLSTITSIREMDYLYTSGDEQDCVAGSTKREKRLERNRESARKCRKKRKAYVGDLEDKVNALTEANTALELENVRLQQLLRQLQSGSTVVDTSDNSNKRAKSEFGVLMANDFSESAERANNSLLHSPQLEKFFQLAICTTFLLCLVLVAVLDLAKPLQWKLASVPSYSRNCLCLK